MNRLLPARLLLVSLFLAPDGTFASDDAVVFGCNYSLSASIDGRDFSVSHQDRVRSGSTIPIHLEDYLLQLRITAAPSRAARIELILSAKTADGWHRVYASPPTFTADLGVPVDFRYDDDVASFEISLIVSTLEP